MVTVFQLVWHCYQDNFMSLEYKKYLEEVVQLLESDEGFKAELAKMDTDGDNVGVIYLWFYISVIYHFCYILQQSNLLLLEYREYLNQTIFILEEDPEFRRLVDSITDEELKVYMCRLGSARVWWGIGVESHLVFKIV